jgi:hypothetical protein
VKEEAVLGQRGVRISDERGEEEERRGAGHFTDSKKLRRPARWRPVPLGATARTRMGGGAVEAKRVGLGSVATFIGQGEGKGSGDRGQLAIDGHGGRPDHEGIQRGRGLMEKKLKRVKEGE